ncbi:MAG: hypothetical protein IKU46_03005 [Peptococcaceae bacterium]|nr:hypothetical protein [Peptococcaceae bacterium]
MNTKIKKVISILLTIFFVCNIFSPAAFASPDYSNLANTNTVESIADTNKSEAVVEPRNAVTKIVKSAINFIKNNKEAAAEVIESVSGSTVAKNFLKYYDKVVEVLEPLLEWSEIPAQAVYDAVRRVLVSAGVSETVAVNIALAIKEGLSWFV